LKKQDNQFAITRANGERLKYPLLYLLNLILLAVALGWGLATTFGGVH
jgi:hypothetical protein